MPSKSFCSAAGRGLHSCSRPGRSDAYCTRKSRELLSCRRGTGNNTGTGNNDYEDHKWYELDTSGYYIYFDNALDGYFIRDPNEVIHFVANINDQDYQDQDEKYYDNDPIVDGYVDPVTGENIGFIKNKTCARTTSCSCAH